MRYKPKLSPEAVTRIRADYATGNYSQGELARREGCHINTIARIVRLESRIQGTLSAAVSNPTYWKEFGDVMAGQISRHIKQRNDVWEELSEEERQNILRFGGKLPEQPK